MDAVHASVRGLVSVESRSAAHASVTSHHYFALVDFTLAIEGRVKGIKK